MMQALPYKMCLKSLSSYQQVDLCLLIYWSLRESKKKDEATETSYALTDGAVFPHVKFLLRWNIWISNFFWLLI